jgi:putative phosphoribosyl transferase
MIMNKFQLRFKNRIVAAMMLGEALTDRIAQNERNDTVILGIPRAGVLTADIVASRLAISNFSIIVPRKLRLPGSMENAMGAIMEDGTTYLNCLLLKDSNVTPEHIENERLIQMREIRRRMALYQNKQPRSISGCKNIVIVDDGAATGATVIASVKWLQKNQAEYYDATSYINRKRLIIALPVAPKHTIDLLKKECMAEVEVVISPFSSEFISVEQYHHIFDSVTDSQVISILQSRGLL